MEDIKAVLKAARKDYTDFYVHNVVCSVYEYLFSRAFYDRNRNIHPSSVGEWIKLGKKIDD
jgi:hypothetical protein